MKRIPFVIAAFIVLCTGLSAQCAQMPCVIATASFTNQDHGLARTTLFTPTLDGTFRVNAYMTVTKPTTPTSADWAVFLNWNDGLRASRWFTGAQGGFTNAGTATIVVHTIAGQPVEYRTAIEGGTSNGMKYDLFIVVEQLQ
jgi:hypothetical protein